MDNRKLPRYVVRRVAGSWQVQDSQFNDFVMGEYGAGSAGAARAQTAAESLNDAPEPLPAQADNDSRSSDNLRSPAGLRAWRHAHKLSQEKLAELLEVRPLTVLRWEQGQVPIPKTTELALLYLDHVLGGWETLSSTAV